MMKNGYLPMINKERVSKRILGAISITIGLMMSFLSGFNWFNPESMVIASIFTLGGTLLGIDAWKQLKTQ